MACIRPESFSLIINHIMIMFKTTPKQLLSGANKVGNSLEKSIAGTLVGVSGLSNIIENLIGANIGLIGVLAITAHSQPPQLRELICGLFNTSIPTSSCDTALANATLIIVSALFPT